MENQASSSDVEKLDVHALNSACVADLRESLLTVRGRNVELSVQGLEGLSALGVQLLVSASKQWQVDGLRFQVTSPVSEFCLLLRGFGLNPEILSTGREERQ
ncbi:hypothetical protein ACS3SW_15585 [Roseobacteraceae bacterium S113]